MPGPRSVETLVDVAHRYYIERESQQDIARAIGSTRSNVSRMLTAARDRGIVRIEVVRPPDRDERAEQILIRRFGLRQAVVHGGEDRSMRSVARLAADWVIDEVEDGMRIAVSWGRSLSAMVRSISGTHETQVEVIQAGGDLQLPPQFSGHELVRGLAERLGGSYSYLPAPAIVDAPSTIRELRRTRSIATQLDKARTADLALIGIGGFGTGFAARLLSSGHLQAEERETFDAIAPAGDILARFFDEHGRQLETPLRDRVLALELEELAGIPTTVGIAQGVSKARGVLGALRGGLVDVLITDADTVDAVLALDDAAVLV